MKSDFDFSLSFHSDNSNQFELFIKYTNVYKKMRFTNYKLPSLIGIKLQYIYPYYYIDTII